LHVERITASLAMPDSRSDLSASGTFVSAKANRSRSSTGDEWWLRPMTTTFIRKK